tara:strand:+ start:348 stop:1226 length:879 start_codon:yes stop_codon:yes gene_type:complete
MKILLLGSNGQVGSEIVRTFSDQDCNLISLSSKELDVSDFKLLSKKILDIHPDILINATAYTNVDDAENEIEEAFLVNSEAVDIIAKNIKLINSKLIHISTDYVFDGKSQKDYSEEDLTTPINIYGESKLLGEKNIKKQLDEHIILRTSWVYGKNGNNFVKTMIKNSHKNQLKIINDQHGNPTSASSISKVLWKICEVIYDEKFSNFGIYHFSNSTKVSWYDFAKLIFNQAAKKDIIGSKPNILPIQSKEFNQKAKRPKDSSLSIKKITKVFAINDYKLSNELSRVLEDLRL